MSASPPASPKCRVCGTCILPTLNARLITPDELLKTFIASPSQACLIQARLRDVEADAEALECTTQMLKSALALAQQKADHLQLSANRCRALLAPISRLPVELLAQIFLDATHTLEGNTGIRARLELAQICSQWRDVAINTPSLWGRWDVVPAWEYPQDTCLTPSLLKHVWIPRSRNIPVAVRLTDPSETRALTTEILPLLLPTCSRWREFYTSGYYDPSHLLRELGPTPPVFPLLQKIHIGDDAECTDSGVDLVQALSETPEVREARLELWVPMVQYLNYLQKHPLLTTLALGLDLDVEVGRSPSHVEHDTLQTWHITCCHIIITTIPVFSRVTLPSLKEFALSSSEADTIWDHKGFTSFLTRSNCSIRSFSLEYVRIEPADLLAALVTLPTLETLSLQYIWTNPPSALFASLTYPESVSSENAPGAPRLLPKLRELRLASRDEEEVDEFDEESLLNMAWSRLCTTSDARLRVLGLGQQNVRGRVKAEILHWKEAGLQLHFMEQL